MTEGAPETAINAHPAPRSRRLPRPGQLRRGHSVHYSKVVRLLRILLPAVAGALIFVAALWPSLNRVETQLRQGLTPAAPVVPVRDVRMENARFFGVDRNSRPFTVTAERAVQLEGAPNDPQKVRLELPQADVTLADGTWLALTAKSGIYEATGNQLSLKGNVNVFHDKGYEIATTAAKLDLESGTASGTEPVQGQGPFGLLRGENGFEIRDGGEVVAVKGKAKLIVESFPGRGDE